MVLMAGGGGTRLWPLSRRDNPKQFLDLGSGQTLLEHTYERARAIAEPENIFVATVHAYAARIQELLPTVPTDNVFLEPARRETAPAFAAVAAQLVQRGHGDEPTIFMWSDHVLTREDAFIADLKRLPGLVAAHPDAVVIMGHTPTFPETGFGYIQTGEPLAGEAGVFWVKAFKEKPQAAEAEAYVAAGDHFWNMAYISTRPAYLLAELTQYEPELVAGIERFATALAAGDHEGATAAYGALEPKAIDYALLERTPRLLMVTGDYGWSDVGNWAAVQAVFGTAQAALPRGHHVHVDSENNYIYDTTGTAVSLIGVKNTIVVITDDALLITDREHSGRVKEVVARLTEEGKTELL